MNEPTIEQIREHHNYVTEKTPAPWRWHGQDNSQGGSVYLATDGHGRIYIMGFARRGMQQAEPMFQVWPEEGFGVLVKASEGLIRRVADYRDDIADIDNPHAEYLKRAPEYVGTLLAEVERLRAELAQRDNPQVRPATLETVHGLMPTTVIRPAGGA
jgi:hypothetical protein